MVFAASLDAMRSCYCLRMPQASPLLAVSFSHDLIASVLP
jgi:hypothetical protein